MIIAPAKRLDSVKEYYFSRKLQEIREMNSESPSVINLGIGNPDMPPSPQTIQALVDSAQQPSNHGYQSYRGLPELRGAIANWYSKTYHVNVDAEAAILPLIGSKEGIMHISMAFLNEGDEVLVPNPGYPTYSSVSELVQAKIRTYDLLPENNWEIDIDALEHSDLSNVKIMWINYPHMPTGTAAVEHTFDHLIALAHKYEFLIVNDNPYSLVLNDTPTSILSRPNAEDVCLELNSLSKSHNMAGWRLGWLVGKPTYIDTVLKVKSNMDSGMFLPVQHAAIEALNNSDEWHAQRNKEYEERRALAFAIFDRIGCTYDKSQVGMFVLAKLPADVQDEPFIDRLLHGARVFITPGFIFGSNGAGYLRASLCTPKDKFNEALQRIDNFLNSEA